MGSRPGCSASGTALPLAELCLKVTVAGKEITWVRCQASLSFEISNKQDLASLAYARQGKSHRFRKDKNGVRGQHMINNITYKFTIKKKIVTKANLYKLALLCFEPRKNELDRAEQRWNAEEISKIDKKIIEHNRDVEAKKSTYSFNTNLPISDEQKAVIVNQEKKWFIHTALQVYPFDSSFKVTFKNNKVIEQNEPYFLNDLNFKDVSNVKMSVQAGREGLHSGAKSPDIKSVKIDLESAFLSEGITYEISGENEDWVRSKKAEIEEALEGFDNIPTISEYVLPISIFSSLILSCSLYSLFYKFNANDLLYSLGYNNPDFLGFVLFVISVPSFFVYSAKELRLAFPLFIISDNYSPFKRGSISVVWFVFCGLGINALYDLAKTLWR